MTKGCDATNPLLLSCFVKNAQEDVINHINAKLDAMNKTGEHQVISTFLRADYQQLDIENYEMNMTSNTLERSEDTQIRLTSMVFLSQDRRGSDEQHLGVADIATDADGNHVIIHVFSTKLIPPRHLPDNSKTYDQLEAELERIAKKEALIASKYANLLKNQTDGRGGVSTGDWLGVVVLMSLVCGFVGFQVSKSKTGASMGQDTNTNPNRNVRRQGGEVYSGSSVKDDDVGVELRSGLDMRPIDGTLATTNTEDESNYDQVHL